ncbi:SixA phosphatase family protein [Sphingomonas sp.]|uniref:SixA phosphatase family protein n=1 Tax=Sphingomonas sp. TaxID=28214 RepID=UPI0038AEA651
MKRLAVLRHAKSDWGDAQIDDHNRPLNERGWKAARCMGRELKQRGIKFDLVLASTAARVRETLDGLREKYDFGSAPIQFEPLMYTAGEAELLSLVRDLPESVHAPLLVGHNPGLEQLVKNLTRDDGRGLRGRIAHKYPTAAFALVELPAHRWADVESGSGELVELILPKDLD